MTKPVRVYIAGFFDTRKRLYPMRDRLQTLGYEVTSRWLDEAPDAIWKDSTPEYLKRCAIRDIIDIGNSDIFILDTIDETPRGGREVELGLAWNLTRYLVGPRRNVFHHCLVQFHTWEALLTWLSSIRSVA